MIGARRFLALAVGSFAVMAAGGAMGCRREARPAGDMMVVENIGVDRAEIIRRYNARVARLSRIWGRAIVSIEYTDDKGGRRYEQGDGFLQFLQPSRLALSLGKASETLLWLGCDAERYWIIEPRERRAAVGRHDRLNDRTLERLQLPAAPLDLIMMFGLSRLPEEDGASAAGGGGGGGGAGAQVRWVRAEEGGTIWLQVDVERAGRAFRLRLDPKSALPRVVQALDRPGGSPIVSASLDRYLGVQILGEPAFFPQIPSLVRIDHITRNAVIKVTLEGLNDGRVDGGEAKGRLGARNFDFESLRQSQGVREIMDLDARE